MLGAGNVFGPPVVMTSKSRISAWPGFLIRRAVDRQAAQALTGRPVLQMRFQQIDWIDEFDGIWTCASLLHVPLIETHPDLQILRVWTTPDVRPGRAQEKWTNSLVFRK